jgi:beta-lactam-binding protein with PASTA domain
MQKKIPAFYGLNRQEITELAKKTNLECTLISLPAAYSNGMCFAQAPSAGSLSRDKKISVYIAEGTNRLRMIPDVRGLVYDEAAPLLAKAGITHELFNVSDAGELTLPDHKIIDQRPRAGTFVPSDRGLHLQLQAE